MARARRSASSRESFSKWNAMRWAPFGPTPGIRPSSSIRSCTGPAYTSGQTQHSTEAAERLLLGSIHLVHGIVQGGQHEVLQHLDIVRVNSVRADAHGPELHTPGDRDVDRAAAGYAFVHLLGRRRLRIHQLLLHLLRLFEQRTEVGTLVGHTPGRYWSGSSTSAPGNAVVRCSIGVRTSVAGASRRPARSGGSSSWTGRGEAGALPTTSF